MDVEVTLIHAWHQMDHVSWSLGLFQNHLLEISLNTKPGDCGTPHAHNHGFYSNFIMCEDPHEYKGIETTFG